MDFLIIEPFNALSFILLFSFLILFVVLSVIARKKGTEFASKLLTGLMFVTIAVYCIYKALILYDAEYREILIANSLQPTSFWKELPLQLCNINMLIIPFALITKKKKLLSFSFYIAPIAAFMALVFPAVGFSGFSILTPRIFGFYFTHYMIIFGSLSIGFFGIKKPDLKDIPEVLVMFFILSLVIFGVNTALRASGLAPDANYFFEMEPEGIGFLEMLYGFIPCKYFYIYPALTILFAYILVVIGSYNLYSKFFGKKVDTKENSAIEIE